MDVTSRSPTLDRATPRVVAATVVLALGVAGWSAWLALTTHLSDESPALGGLEYWIAILYVVWAFVAVGAASCGLAMRKRTPVLSLGLAVVALALVAIPAVSLATIPLSA